MAEFPEALTPSIFKHIIVSVFRLKWVVAFLVSGQFKLLLRVEIKIAFSNIQICSSKECEFL